MSNKTRASNFLEKKYDRVPLGYSHVVQISMEYADYLHPVCFVLLVQRNVTFPLINEVMRPPVILHLIDT